MDNFTSVWGGSYISNLYHKMLILKIKNEIYRILKMNNGH